MEYRDLTSPRNAIKTHQIRKGNGKGGANKLDRTTDHGVKRQANRGNRQDRQTKQQAYGHHHERTNGKRHIIIIVMEKKAKRDRTGQVSRDFRCLSLYI
jgi:hypothetical protein